MTRPTAAKEDGAAVLKLAVIAIAGAIFGILVFWIVTIPATVPASELPTYAPDDENGRAIFNVGGCASCHATANRDAGINDRTRLGGGLALKIAIRHFLRTEYLAAPRGRHRQVE